MRAARNDPCPCGSGKKYKSCCLRQPVAAPAARGGPTESLPPDLVRELVALATANRYAEMEALAGELAAADSQSGFAWKALSVAQQMQGKDALHALETAARLLPHDPEPHSNLGAALRQQGRLEDAVLCYRRALKIRPDVAEIWNNLGHALHDSGRVDDALAAFRRALELRPKLVKALNNLGNALKDSGDLDAAVESYRRALRADPHCLEAHVNLGSALRLQARSTDAAGSCQRALEIDPHCIPALLLLADMQADEGRFVEAENGYRCASALQPDSPEAWAGIPAVKRMSLADSDWLTEARRILTHSLPPAREMPLRYAVGKYYDDVGAYEDAFANFARANTLARQIRPRYDRHRVSDGIDRIIRLYHGEWLSRIRRYSNAEADDGTHANGSFMANANASARAVFIVGMPRSGTTLAEQILASHGAAFGGGELPFWNTAVVHHAAASGAAFDARQLTALAGDYLAGLIALSAETARVVDKMPGNYLYLGPIHAALPKARFIHIRRNPLDTCLSIYSQNFGTVHSYANDLDDLAHYYKEYSRIMDHWRGVLPAGVLLEVEYEALVSALEATSRQMIEFIGLPWDPKCLEFHRTTRTVSTFSKWQARQAISARSVGRWRNYESFITPLRSLG